jgi:hypothetical protein
MHSPQQHTPQLQIHPHHMASLHPALQRHTFGSLVMLGRVTCPLLQKWFNLVGSSLK